MGTAADQSLLRCVSAVPRRKAPDALGQPATKVWAEIWDLIGPRTEAALEPAESTFDEALLLIMERCGYPEETYFTFSYSPLRNMQERSAASLLPLPTRRLRIIRERRLRLLPEVAAASSEAHTPEQVGAAAAKCIGRDPRGMPFALLYLTQPGGKTAALVSPAGIDDSGWPGAPPLIDLEAAESTWPLPQAAVNCEAIIVEVLSYRRGIVVPLRCSADRRVGSGVRSGARSPAQGTGANRCRRVRGRGTESVSVAARHPRAARNGSANGARRIVGSRSYHRCADGFSNLQSKFRAAPEAPFTHETNVRGDASRRSSALSRGATARNGAPGALRGRVPKLLPRWDTALDPYPHHDYSRSRRHADPHRRPQRRNIEHYRELQDVISLLGIKELGAEDRRMVERARRLQRFLTQPFAVTETFTGAPGRSVAVADTIAGCKAILAGECDEWQESSLYMVGTIDEARDKEKASHATAPQ